MMRLRVIFFGRKDRTVDEQAETYRRRIVRRWPADEVMLKPAVGRDGDTLRALAVEAESVRRALGRDSVLIALDEGGESPTSEAFARRLEEFESGACRELVFVVGSDLGLHPDLRRHARMCLSLSKMTLPHQLARLVLWEQLFRATHILGGGSYHRGRVD